MSFILQHCVLIIHTYFTAIMVFILGETILLWWVVLKKWPQCFLYASPFEKWVSSSFHQNVESIFSLLESRPVRWLALSHRTLAIVMLAQNSKRLEHLGCPLLLQQSLRSSVYDQGWLAILKYTIQWHLVNLQYCTTTTSIKFQNILLCPKKPILIKQSLLIPPFRNPWEQLISFLSLWIYPFWILL